MFTIYIDEEAHDAIQAAKRQSELIKKSSRKGMPSCVIVLPKSEQCPAETVFIVKQRNNDLKFDVVEDGIEIARGFVDIKDNEDLKIKCHILIENKLSKEQETDFFDMIHTTIRDYYIISELIENGIISKKQEINEKYTIRQQEGSTIMVQIEN